MAALTPCALAVAIGLAAPAAAETVADWRGFMTEASQRFGVPVPWIAHVMRAESGGRTMLNGRPIVSRAGAIGLMQVMPDTWRNLRETLHLGRDPFDPHDNILAGTFFLRLMYDRFGYPGLFAAYNAGPGRYSAYLAGRLPLPGETKVYLARVTGGEGAAIAGAIPPSRLMLFASLTATGRDPVDQSGPVPTPPLFAIKH